MTMGQDLPAPRCPRCGGRMYRPVGSAFYWHADNNHPPCEITNIAEIPDVAPVTENHTTEALEERPQKRDHSG
ncbi:hypothetical protein EPA93_40425 [Ktedonosporobacter rubrisoli]|uniref:Uncharacterized protein n=1 Tax=Ktedonosporobacter rubrisoli TaxID=2509675 RepID=A0A4V0Z042_KTERU|nr:hypothetical protein [Ktedonosporobacter rubrisoli]QBD81911.1 hypothetical protein EPA93_40425 [Ktedonosporobacter rubrisoli]